MDVATDVIQTASSIVQTVLLLGAVLIAWWEVSSAREEARKTRTLDACNRYDFDQTLHESLVALQKSALGRKIDANSRDIAEIRLPMITVLNYLDGLAIGLEQGVYDTPILDAHMRTIVQEHYSNLMRPELLERVNLKDTDFIHLMRLQKRYENPVSQKKGTRWRIF